MLLMDRENLLARGWSHVLSSSNDLEELDALRRRVGAPPPALHRKNPGRPHLDLKLEPRTRALTDPEVKVFESTRDLVLYWRACQPHPR
jgi:hypothetical protein